MLSIKLPSLSRENVFRNANRSAKFALARFDMRRERTKERKKKNLSKKRVEF